MKKYLVGILSIITLIIVPSLASATVADIDPAGQTEPCVSLQNNLRYKTKDALTNGEVSTLQDFLQEQDFLSSEPTGYFGLLTLKAVKSFQSANEIVPTGYVGPMTRARIFTLSKCGTAVVASTPVALAPTSSPSTIVSGPVQTPYLWPISGDPIIKNQLISSLSNIGQAVGAVGDTIVLYGQGFVNSSSGHSSSVEFFQNGINLGAVLIDSNNITLDGTKMTFVLDPAFLAKIGSGPFQIRIATPGYGVSNFMNFTTSPRSVVKVTFPAENSQLQVGQTYTIMWTGSESGISSYVVHLIGGSNGSTNLILGTAYPKTDGSGGSFNWTVPTSVGPSMYQIQIGGQMGTGGTSFSFAVTPPATNVPVISSISSNQGRAGDTIVITGQNFLSRGNTSIVDFIKNGQVIGSTDPTARGANWGTIVNPISADGTRLQFIVDPIFVANAGIGNYQIRISNPYGDGHSVSNSVDFNIVSN